MVACPRCHSQDAVQKVSSIVAGGTYETTYQVPAQGQLAGHTIYGTVTEHGTGQTELARQLSIPRSQKEWEKLANDYATAVGKAFTQNHPAPKAGCFPQALQWVGGLCFFVGVYGITTASSVWMAVGVVVFWSLLGFGLYKLGQRLAPAARKEWELAIGTAKAQARMEANPQSNGRILSRYDRLYYCYRDDIVFVPDEDRCAPSSDMMQMLMSN
jgi:hypothetical protein